MARTKKTEVVADDLEGTVEGLARDHFEREKAAYEERTGVKVNYVPPAPLTRTPIDKIDDLPPAPEITYGLDDAIAQNDGEDVTATGQGDE